MKQFRRTLFIFRRDLRLDDNNALLAALEQSEEVIPLFIFDPRQIGPKNDYRSLKAIAFMIDSLHDLDGQLNKKQSRLLCGYDVAEEFLDRLLSKSSIDAVFWNKDYTPFSLKRDEQLEHVCIRHQKSFFSLHDALLINPETVHSASNTPYTIFTPFFKTTAKLEVSQPRPCRYKNFASQSLPETDDLTTLVTKLGISCAREQLIEHGGTTLAKGILKKIGSFSEYGTTHDFPEIPTTLLSPHNKFGTISIRQVYHSIAKKLGEGHPLIRQLYWRDFFTYVAYHSPFVFGAPYHEKWAKIPWENDEAAFKRWCQGTTGFPLVDAGMRQLNQTGFMANRVRMVVASFLVKDLHIDWRWGERYFAQHLIDYDPAVNNGNWQWAASTGCDAQPYFRIFNPWIQQKKFDPECLYIKQWIPELKQINPKIIHAWFKQKDISNIVYPAPMIDHSAQARRALAIYKRTNSLS